jgi:signal transduction histidine kinase
MPKDALILIVDDDPTVRETYQALLHRENHRLEFAESGPQALKMTEILLPDLILLDVMMPTMDGFEVSRRIKSRESLRHIPIVIITALDGKADLVKGLESGADEFLTKPVRGAELRARVRSMLRIKHLYDDLNATIRLREDLAGMIVHDIRSPLSTILGYSQILRGDISDSNAASILDKIVQQVFRLDSMMTDMLMMTKMEADRLRLNKTTIDLNRFLEGEFLNHKPAADLKGIQLVLEIPDSSRSLVCDANLFQRLLFNLISNALKFSPKESTVRLRLTSTGEGANSELTSRIQIIDEGPGIPSQDRERIFEKYEIVKMKWKGERQFGLGLAFCRLVAAAHDWMLYVVENKPKGSIFTLEM